MENDRDGMMLMPRYDERSGPALRRLGPSAPWVTKLVLSGFIWRLNVSLELHSMKSGMGEPHVRRMALDSSMRMSSALVFFCMNPNMSTYSRHTCRGVLSSETYRSLITRSYEGAWMRATWTSRSLVIWMLPIIWLSWFLKFSRPWGVIMKLCSRTIARPCRTAYPE